MAERRMFSLKVVDGDAFLDLPLAAQALYFHLGMRADDDGFLNNSKKILRMIEGATDEDFRMLVDNGFVYVFESGVVVVMHWKIHNQLRKDRYHPTQHITERAMLVVQANGSYRYQSNDEVEEVVNRPDGNQEVTEIRLDNDSRAYASDSLVEANTTDNLDKMKPPSLEEVQAYCVECGYNINAEAFWNLNNARNWRCGNAPITNWRSLVDYWVSNNRVPKYNQMDSFMSCLQNNYHK